MRFLTPITLSLISTLSLAQTTANKSRDLLNSASDERNPVLSPDGKTLFVTLSNHAENVGGKKDPGDIWIAVLGDNNQWSAPVHGGPLLNDRYYNGVAGLSADGNSLFLLSHYDPSGQPKSQGISVSRRTGSGWSKPENITIPYFQNKSATLSGYITPDQSIFVFSAETYGTRGVEDIYVTRKGANGGWTEPRNLGSVINTPFQELSPSISADGTTLYFSSNGRKGHGSFDVFTTSRLDDTWTNWSEPVNMEAINTSGRDLYYRPYEDKGMSLYTTTENSDVYGNVRAYITGDARPPIDKPVLVAVDTPAVAPEPQPVDTRNVALHGIVKNARTGEAVTASLSFIRETETLKAAAQPGNGYQLTLPKGNVYSVTIEATGYVSSMESLDIRTFEMRELEMNYTLQPVEVGTTVNLRNVLFEQGKTRLLSESYPELDLVISFLKANPNVKIELAGHTDNRGIPSQNVKLSQARVDKVKEYLTSKGVDKKRITGKGYGGAKPVASNDSEETRQLNRRVEFIIRKL